MMLQHKNLIKVTSSAKFLYVMELMKYSKFGQKMMIYVGIPLVDDELIEGFSFNYSILNPSQAKSKLLCNGTSS
jgi:hypothetical protein